MTGLTRHWRNAVTLLMLALPGCATVMSPPPTAFEVTGTHQELDSLPPPAKPLVVAVYGYQDQTGQFKATDTVASYSHAVTQGATSVLIKALQDAGQGRWFTVVERERLNNLVTERQIVREQRQNYTTPEGKQLPPLPPMLYAGLLLEGGVIGYDTDTTTGGLGASYLGIGADSQYREDTVTVYLRAVSTQSGEVLNSVMVKKKIISYGLQGSIFKFVAYQKLLQIETGFTSNEPALVALRQAIEEAVVALVVQGARKSGWSFADAAAGTAFANRWLADQGAIEAADRPAGRAVPAAAPATNSAEGAPR